VTRARRLWIGAGAVVVLAVASYLVVSLTYQLEPGDTWAVGEGATFPTNDQDVALHELRQGQEVQIGITVRNPGRLPIAFDEVDLGGADILVDEVTMIEHAGRGPQCCRPQDAKPFHRVNLGTDDQVMLWLVLRITPANFYSPCTGFTLESADIRYRVMGMPRSQQLPLRTKIEFQAPCP
jgi:hypothetical protein